jgi:hypothetical protein
MCRLVVPADFREISSMPGGFQYDYQGKQLKSPQNSACGAILAHVALF